MNAMDVFRNRMVAHLQVCQVQLPLPQPPSPPFPPPPLPPHMHSIAHPPRSLALLD